MKEARFEAVCPVEIGDKVILVDGSRMAAGWQQGTFHREGYLSLKDRRNTPSQILRRFTM